MPKLHFILKKNKHNQFQARAAEQTDQMTDLRTKLKEKIKAIDDLEAEIKDQEDIRNTVMHLVSKRKK